MSLQPSERESLERLIGASGTPVRVVSAAQLSGGASRQTFSIETDGGAGRYVLQRELSAEPRLPNGMADEALVITEAARLGVPTPVVIGTNLDVADGSDAAAGEIGRSFFVSEYRDGETIARRILRDDRFATARTVLAGQLGTALATLHGGLDPSRIPWLEETDELARYREVADELDLVSPAFELAFRWLAANTPDGTRTRRTVVHGDFRLGNLIIDEDGLAAVIDWELAHIGDPMEDLGWVCVRAWRFGGPKPVAGMGDHEEFFAAYEAASGTPVDREAVTWWETLGTLKWGIMCGTQSNRHLSGDVPSVELAAIGPRVAEQEYDVLRLIAPRLITGGGGERVDSAVGQSLGTGGAEGGGRPSASDLVDAVRRFLTDDVMAATTGRTGFHARVAANALATVGRELALREAMTANRTARLGALGFNSERDLATAIRKGAVDDRLEQVTDAVYDLVVHRLSVNNPRWIES
ncbi:MAG: phosphotransferase family protein [Actinomycetota bacterium]